MPPSSEKSIKYIWAICEGFTDLLSINLTTVTHFLSVVLKIVTDFLSEVCKAMTDFLSARCKAMTDLLSVFSGSVTDLLLAVNMHTTHHFLRSAVKHGCCLALITVTFFSYGYKLSLGPQDQQVGGIYYYFS